MVHSLVTGSHWTFSWKMRQSERNNPSENTQKNTLSELPCCLDWYEEGGLSR
jgi:hypothetical protein